MDLDFSCDRQAKNDFTASTDAYDKEEAYPGTFQFFEMDDNGNLVPFGSSAVSITSHYDIWGNYITSAGTQKYVFELKERHHLSTRYTTAFINEEKWPEFLPYIEKGWKAIWVELYTDDTIRVWDLTKVDFTQLPLSKRWIKKTTVDPNSPKVLQLRREIPMEWGKIIRRIKG